MSTCTDSFNRADNASSLGSPDVGPPWTAVAGTWGIATNRAYNPGGTGGALAVLDSASADVDVQVTFPNLASGGTDARLIARLADSSNYLLVRGRPGLGYDLFKDVAGSFTGLLTGVGTVADGDTVKLSCVGSAIKVYVNGTQVGTTQTVTDGQTNTNHGIGANADSVSRFEDFSITDVGGSGAAAAVSLVHSFARIRASTY